MITRLEGVLEIDHKRGVIYFHKAKPDACPTPLRIGNLPREVPSVDDFQLDILHLCGCNWGDSTFIPPTQEGIDSAVICSSGFNTDGYKP